MGVDIIKFSKFGEKVIKKLEVSESHSILFYSTDRGRDYKILEQTVKELREELTALLADGHTGTEQAGACIGKSDIQKESL
jgi:hypothetical protein